MKIDLNKNLIDYKGVEVEKANMGDLLAQYLVQNPKGFKAIKVFDWALKLGRGETLDLDAADITQLKLSIESDGTVTVLVKAQMIKEFDKALASEIKNKPEKSN